jgi:hypothetical protein
VSEAANRERSTATSRTRIGRRPSKPEDEWHGPDGRIADPRTLTRNIVVALQRAAGNRAVSGALGGSGEARTSSATPTGVTVQRWAWVGAKQVMPTEQGLDANMKALAGDNLVHSYFGQSEFADHAAGKTDYLGNLPDSSTSPGTWVRFSRKGTNLLGENHEQVTLEQVAPAVGSTSFIFEPFSTDVLTPGSAMEAAYDLETKDRYADFGVVGVADKRQFGAESLYPKMGFALTLLLPYFTGENSELDGLKAGGYVGKPTQRYLRIAWAHAKDVADEVAQLKAAKKVVPSQQKKLAKAFESTKANLDAFITALPVTGYLGDALDTQEGKAKLPALAKFTKAFIAAMLARIDSDTELTKEERKKLRKMDKDTLGEQSDVLDEWRNLHFMHALADAVARGVRYAGMGRNHLVYLEDKGLPAGSHAWDMVGQDIADFEFLTKILAASAQSP